VVWCKACGPGTAHEPALLEAFQRWHLRAVTPVLATDPTRALALTPDGGPTLRKTRPDGSGDHDLAAWERILRTYAGLQRATESHLAELRSIGVPDGSPGSLTAIIQGLIDDQAVWDRADPEDRAAAHDARRRLPDLLPVVAAWADELDGSGVARSIQHDDLHGGNVLVGPAGDRIFDWGDASVAHPFGTMTTTMNSIEHATGIDQHGREMRRLRDAYLEAWSDVAPLSALVAAEERARLLGAVGRAASWERSFRGLAVDQLEGHGGATAAWLVELVARIDRRAGPTGGL
jgi:aminoglycoside phosphotransferase (APT) family kinase protein